MKIFINKVIIMFIEWLKNIFYFLDDNAGGITFIATLVIGGFQIIQNIRMSNYQKENDKKSNMFQNEVEERNQDFQEKIKGLETEIKELNELNLELQNKIDKRDEFRHNDNIEALAYSFIHENSEDIDFLPFCLIACMYDRSYKYRRVIYNRFCSLSIEVQNKILELRNIDLERTNVDNFYKLCYDAWMHCIEVEKLDNLDECYNSIYNDGGKYIEDLLLDFGNEKRKDFSKERKELTDILGNFFLVRDLEYPIRPIAELLGFYKSDDTPDEIHSCLVATEIARYSAIYSKNKHHDFYVPTVAESYTDIYLEDVFLATLFEIYFNLVLEDNSND